MEYRQLGASGLQVSALSFGAWVTFGEQVDDGTAEACLHAAWDAGVNFFDNAEVYADGRAETVMGDIIRRAGWHRSDFVVSTKIFWGGAGPEPTAACRASTSSRAPDAALARLQLDYVDLLYCHRPDLHTPIEETVRAMSWLVDQGLALYWGTSEWDARQIRGGARHRPPRAPRPADRWSSRSTTCSTATASKRNWRRSTTSLGLGTTIWSPLASGILTGKYNDGVPPGTRHRRCRATSGCASR